MIYASFTCFFAMILYAFVFAFPVKLRLLREIGRKWISGREIRESARLGNATAQQVVFRSNVTASLGIASLVLFIVAYAVGVLTH